MPDPVSSTSPPKYAEKRTTFEPLPAIFGETSLVKKANVADDGLLGVHGGEIVEVVAPTS
jgi:hypothetical protein